MTMPTHRARPDSPSPAARSILALAAAAVLAALAVRLIPIAAFPFDWEATDGDVLNLVQRLLLGLPQYTDWTAGDILLPYPPFYHCLLALGARMGADPVLFGRGLNLVLLLAAILVGTLILCDREEDRFRLGPAALMFPALFALNWRVLEGAVDLRADTLLLFLQALLAGLLASFPSRAVFLGLLCGVIPFAKQLGVGASFGAALWLGSRALPPGRVPAVRVRDLARFLLSAAGTGLALTLLFEGLDHGRFLKVVLAWPSAVFAGRLLDWSHLGMVLSQYYADKPWVLVLAAWGAFGRRGGRLSPLMFLLACDACVVFLSARNIGGSYAYLWFHWFLVSIFASLGAADCAGRVSGLLRKGQDRGLAACACVLLCCVPYEAELLSFRVRSTASLWRAADSHQQLIRRIAAENPGAKWVSMRHSMALVRAGVVLDQDWCTMELAFAGPAGFDPGTMVRRLAGGEYRFIQAGHSGCIFDEPLRPVISDCFSPLARSQVTVSGRIEPALILRHDPQKKSCLAYRTGASGSAATKEER